MTIDWLLADMSRRLDDPAMAWGGDLFDYRHILDSFDDQKRFLAENDVRTGQVVSLEADYSPETIALLLALIHNNNIVVPLASAIESGMSFYRQTAQVSISVSVRENHFVITERQAAMPRNPVTRRLVDIGEPGLVLFSSGSTGTPKAALHSFPNLLEKFKVPRKRLITVAFLLIDHIGGMNTLFYTLSNGGTLVTVDQRDPESICRVVEKRGVQLLPTSPTFLNLLLMSEAYRRHDLSSLELITYGTEVMPESTLARLHELFPNVRLQQTYGLSELGILRSKSKEPDSLWVKVGGEGFETKVIDGTLWIRAHSAMVGYLNAPDPFDAEGWFNTQDQVEVDETGEFIRILGRRSDIINVGGEKVYPAEVESVIRQMANVEDVTVHGERNPIVGNVVVAKINLLKPEDPSEFKTRMRGFCRQRLPRHKIPAKVEFVKNEMFNARFKRVRR